MLSTIVLLVTVFPVLAQPGAGSLAVTGSSEPAASLREKEKAGFPLAGTWLLKAAEAILADGTRVTDSAYGTNAKGVLMIDDEGQYSLQIFNPGRPKFVSGDKRTATPAEYAAALLGISTHVGHISIDSIHHTLQFNIDYAAYPNWDHTTQIRQYKLTRDELYYEVPSKAAGGTIPVSIWRRAKLPE